MGHIHAFHSIHLPHAGCNRGFHSLVVLSSTSAPPSFIDNDVLPNFGETAGAILLIEKGLLMQGDAELIYDIDWSIMPGERVALVGANGAGKSTLLSSIAGHKSLTEGELLVKPGTRLGYLVQKGVSGSTLTVYEEAKSQMKTINAAAVELEKALAAVENAPEDGVALDALQVARTRFDAVGGSTQSKEVSRVLSGLGFSNDDQHRLCSEFSGGWQMRIALGRLLLSDSDVLLLDEPTNHLDASAKRWLGDYLGKYPGTIITVSHDDALLHSMDLSSVAEVRAGELNVYRGCNYSRFKVEREERMRKAQMKRELEQKEMDRLQGFVDRFSAGTRSTAAQSRLKRLEKMEDAGLGDSGVVIQTKIFKPKIKLPSPPACQAQILSLMKASFAMTEGPPLVTDATLHIEKGMTIVILGPNGAGKSTTLRALSGDIPILSGKRTTGTGLSIGMFTQDLAQDLPGDRIALELVLERARERDIGVSDEMARDVLGAMGLTGAKALRPIGWLSGGEKARVALAIFVLVPYNLLLLDEPSNHLDVQTLEALVDAIKRWKGTTVVVSHNKGFVETIRASHTVIVNNGKLTFHNRPPESDDWLWGTDNSGTNTSKSNIHEAKKVERERQAVADKQRKRRINAPTRINKIELLIAEIETKMSGIDDKLYAAGSDAGLAMDLTNERQVEEAKVAELYREWEELEALLEEPA